MRVGRDGRVGGHLLHLPARPTQALRQRRVGQRRGRQQHPPRRLRESLRRIGSIAEGSGSPVGVMRAGEFWFLQEGGGRASGHQVGGGPGELGPRTCRRRTDDSHP